MNSNMIEKEAIIFHLTNSYNKINGLTYFSGFCGALKDARKMTGRNLETGEKDDTNKFGHLGSWLGTIGYFSLLDQIGNCFRKVNGPTIEANKSGIIKALKNFTDLQDDHIDALYALRNSFAHDFSLQNIGRRTGLTHHFKVDNSSSNPVVILPECNWDGVIQNKNSNNETYVNLQAFGDLVESICAKLTKLTKSEEIEIVLEGGKEELISRYSFVTGHKIL